MGLANAGPARHDSTNRQFRGLFPASPVIRFAAVALTASLQRHDQADRDARDHALPLGASGRGSVSLLGLLRLSFRPRRLLGPLRHKRIVFRRATARGCIRRQAAHPRRHVRDMLPYGSTSCARGEREDCKAEERQFNRVGRFHLAAISADCGIRRTARANPCHLPALRIRFPD